MADTKLERRVDWDGKVTLLYDGAVILERKSAEEVEQKANYIEARILINALEAAFPKVEKVVDNPPPEV